MRPAMLAVSSLPRLRSPCLSSFFLRLSTPALRQTLLAPLFFRTADAQGEGLPDRLLAMPWARPLRK